MRVHPKTHFLPQPRRGQSFPEVDGITLEPFPQNVHERKGKRGQDTEVVYAVPCGHCFLRKPIEEWEARGHDQCPLCRTLVDYWSACGKAPMSQEERVASATEHYNARNDELSTAIHQFRRMIESYEATLALYNGDRQDIRIRETDEKAEEAGDRFNHCMHKLYTAARDLDRALRAPLNTAIDTYVEASGKDVAAYERWCQAANKRKFTSAMSAQAQCISERTIMLASIRKAKEITYKRFNLADDKYRLVESLGRLATFTDPSIVGHRNEMQLDLDEYVSEERALEYLLADTRNTDIYHPVQ